MRILVAMSGGIDSSVVAHLLKEQGHEVIGVRFTIWMDPIAPPLAQILPSKCCNAQTAARAANVAKTLGVPLHIIDLEKEFRYVVVEPFLDDFRKGQTPNPCVGCNRTIKFGTILAFAKELGCDKLATGHYARIQHETTESKKPRHVLLEAIDKKKDQSYYLYGLTQRQLSSVLFPLGMLMKSDVYALAGHFGVPYEETSYRESQDLCFFPEKNPQPFLCRYLKEDLVPGDIVRRGGKVIGKHRGVALYTIGQRRLGIGGSRVPLEVVEKDVKNNRLVVNDRGRELIHALRVRDVRWVSRKPDKNQPVSFECRLRALAPRKKGTFMYEGTRGAFTFHDPQPPQTAGQHLVLYKGEEIIGGGIMV